MRTTNFYGVFIREINSEREWIEERLAGLSMDSDEAKHLARAAKLLAQGSLALSRAQDAQARTMASDWQGEVEAVGEGALDALMTFAIKHKRAADWREELSMAWMNGRDDREPGGHLLRRIRNRLGPSWLFDNVPADLNEWR